VTIASPGQTVYGTTAWSGSGVLPGLFTYAIVATDQADNITQSHESKSFIVA